MLSQQQDDTTTITNDNNNGDETTTLSSSNTVQQQQQLTDNIDELYNDSLTSIATLASTLPSLSTFDLLAPPSMINNINNGGGNVVTSCTENKDCEYLKLVSGFKRTLVIPDAFFLNVMPLCYCNSCLSLSSSSSNVGTSSTNSILKGWVRFTINQFVTNVPYTNSSSSGGDGSGGGSSSAGGTSLSSTDSSNDWTTAFYLTRVDKIRAILDHGQPLPIEPYEGSSCHPKDDSGPGAHLILSSSPNANNKPQTTFAHRYMSGSTVYTIGTAFEVRVKTQSLCAPDVIDDESIDADVGSSSLTFAGSSSVQMWTTKEAGACVLTAVLLKLEPVDIVEESLY